MTRRCSDRDIAALYELGVPVKDIMETCGLRSVGMLYNALRRAGARRRRRPVRRLGREDLQEMVRLRLLGLGYEAIGRRMGLSANRVYQVLKELGVE